MSGRVGLARALSTCAIGAFASACAAHAVDAFEPIDCNEVPRSDRCSFDVWPNPGSRANSDRWLVVNHDALREIRPRVLVLNFDNQSRGDAAIRPSIDARIQALAEGSRYHGYRDNGALPFVQYELAGIVDYTDADPLASPFDSSTRVPVGADGDFDVHALFGPSFSFDEPGTGRSVGLCELFETGAVNEVWLAVADGEREPRLMLERKQRYDDSFSSLPGQFNACVRDSCLEVDCGVTVRVAHLNPHRGAGCDLQVRGWAIENTGLSVPYLAENATAFFNADFRERFGVDFASLSDFCGATTPCVSYPSRSVAEAVDGTWRFPLYRQGCGTPEFPPNASARYDWRSETLVDSRCEHYGLGDGENGDQYEPYNFSNLTIYEGLIPDDADFPMDCGGGWQVYWRQSMPGLGNAAIAADGTPMKNWWPFMFY